MTTAISVTFEKNEEFLFFIFQELSVKDRLCAFCADAFAHLPEFSLLPADAEDCLAVLLPLLYLCIIVRKFCRFLS